jgi:hypothetical protein
MVKTMASDNDMLVEFNNFFGVVIKDTVLQKDLKDILEINKFFDYEFQKDEIITIIKTNKHFSRIFVNKMLDKTINENRLKILDDRDTIIHFYNSMDDDTKNNFVKAITDRIYHYDNHTIVNIVTLLCNNVIEFAEKIVDKIIENKQPDKLNVFQNCSLFKILNEKSRRRLINFLLENMDKKIYYKILIDGIFNSEDFNIAFRSFVLSSLIDNKLHEFSNRYILQSFIQKNKDLAEGFVLFTLNNRTFHNFFFEYDKIKEVLYDNLSEDTKNKLFDYVVKNYKDFEEGFFQVLTSDHGEPCLSRKRLLKYIIDNNDYKLLQSLVVMTHESLFRIKDDDIVHKEFVDYLFKNDSEVLNSFKDPELKFSELYIIAVTDYYEHWDELTTPYENIRNDGLNNSVYFTEKYIEYVISSKLNGEFTTLNAYTVNNLFFNARLNKNKLIDYIIVNIDHISKEFVSNALYNREFTKKFVHYVLDNNKFPLYVEWDKIQNIWNYVYTLSDDLKIKFEDLIYKELKYFDRGQLIMLFHCWRQSFIIKCVEKLEQNKSKYAEYCIKLYKDRFNSF